MLELDERSKTILVSIIQSYIDYNGPIGSRTVMKRFNFGLSSATIRNTMADLEELGFVTQPHTSAGRIPTEKGYRFYVDTIIKEHALSLNKKALTQLAERLRVIEKDINKLIREVSKTLSSFSQYVGLVTVPQEGEITLEHIDFIRHKRDKILCVLISEEGIIKNKIIVLERKTFSQKQLETITRYLNSELKGFTLREIRKKILSKMSKEKLLCDRLIHNALTLLEKVIQEEDETEFQGGEISGACNLADFATMNQIKDLFKAIEEKHLVVKILDKIADADGIQVFIGSENSLSEMKELSFVTSTYTDGRRILGTMGVIGPTRMNYRKIIPIVSHTANMLTQILSEMRYQSR
jgi:heat-inducible transcriptional repressor